MLRVSATPIYRSFKLGNLADLMMLDTRLHGRDRPLDYAADLPMQSGLFNTSTAILASEEEAVAPRSTSGRSQIDFWSILHRRPVDPRSISGRSKIDFW